MDARHRAAERAYRVDPCAATLAAVRRFTGLYALMSPATLRERRDGVAGWCKLGRHELHTREHLDYLARTPRPDVVKAKGRVEFVIRWRWSDGVYRRRRQHWLPGRTIGVTRRAVETTIGGWARRISDLASLASLASLTNATTIRYR